MRGGGRSVPLRSGARPGSGSGARPLSGARKRPGALSLSSPLSSNMGLMVSPGRAPAPSGTPSVSSVAGERERERQREGGGPPASPSRQPLSLSLSRTLMQSPPYPMPHTVGPASTLRPREREGGRQVQTARPGIRRANTAPHRSRTVRPPTSGGTGTQRGRRQRPETAPMPRGRGRGRVEARLEVASLLKDTNMGQLMETRNRASVDDVSRWYLDQLDRVRSTSSGNRHLRERMSYNMHLDLLARISASDMSYGHLVERVRQQMEGERERDRASQVSDRQEMMTEIVRLQRDISALSESLTLEKRAAIKEEALVQKLRAQAAAKDMRIRHLEAQLAEETSPRARLETEVRDHVNDLEGLAEFTLPSDAEDWQPSEAPDDVN
ncbi:hypothetical protein KIPB_004590 [Kipferlia bialata]|uniref:Uncharacterized protein n=1 Tax=Kipferlia bialata TaxID=797122 RepID=A0A9K3CW73_9EUKA|nr:hypothetical protein KIPB_004590 [Kipferlia bialata]|eukprot:g4590.t1